jgi:hypothetical protein
VHRIISALAAVLLCVAFAVANPSGAAAFGHGGFGHGGFAFRGGGFGGFHAFHGGFGFRGLRGFYGGGYYAPYFYGDYPYSLYEDEDDEPDCHFVWVKRTVKHRIVRHGIWTCS